MVSKTLFSSATEEWATPQDLFDYWDSVFHFNIDVCATPENAKCSKFFTKEGDALKQDWKDYICWMNPPYGKNIYQWVEKAYHSAKRGALVVCLLPARTDTRYFHDFCCKGYVVFLKGRLKFGGSKNPAPFPSMVVVFCPKHLVVGDMENGSMMDKIYMQDGVRIMSSFAL